MTEERNNNESAAHQEWCRQFAENALARASRELETFEVCDNQTPLASQRKMAEAVLEIGWMVVNEVGGLLTENRVEECRDNIICGLGDILENGYEDGPHLGHDIVDAIANALGEVPDRTESSYD